MTDDDRRMVLFTWKHLKPLLRTEGISFPLYPMEGSLTEERLADLDSRRIVNLMGIWSGGMAHLEPTPEAVAQLVREGYLDDEREQTAKADALMKGWSP